MRANLGFYQLGGMHNAFAKLGLTSRSPELAAFDKKFKGFIAGQKDKLIGSITKTMDTKLETITGMTEEISVEIEDYLNESFTSGLDFTVLRKRLGGKFKGLNSRFYG